MALNPTSIAIDDANANPAVVSPSNPVPIGGGVASGSTDSGNPVKVGGKYNAAPPTLTDGQRGDLQLGARGSTRVEIADAGGAAFAQVTSPVSDGVSTGINCLRVIAATYTYNGTSLDRTSKATTTSRIVSSAATTNATSGKASSGTVYSIDCLNTSAAVKFLKLYNKATAPTVGTDTPVLTIALPPNNVAKAMTFHQGMYFSAGIAYAITGAAADADATAVAAGDVVGLNITYS